MTQAVDVKAQIDDLDLGPIKYKLVCEYGWSKEEANAVEPQYKGFLYLVVLHPDVSIVPTKRIDEMWHMHILDTRKYAEDCNKLFGRFIHHFPYFGLRGADDVIALSNAFQNTLQLFKNELGMDITQTSMGGCSGGDEGGGGSDGSCTGSSCSGCSSDESGIKSANPRSADCTSGSCGTACGAQCSDYVKSEIRPEYSSL